MNLPSYLTPATISDFIDRALAEDVGHGDHSSIASIPPDVICKAKLQIKDSGVIAGVTLAKMIFVRYDPTLAITCFKEDGDKINRGDIAFVVDGPARSILATERLVLNCMQRMSGIATLTSRMINQIEHTKAQLMDTRKTTPNFRAMEKWAVAIGGGKNHRFALYDMIMLKDNHIDIAKGIRGSLQMAKSYLKSEKRTLAIEIETRTLKEVQQVLEEGGADVIMLDNMGIPEMKKAVALIGGRCKIEASGGITEETLREVAECGVDYISVGALTHSVKSLDLSLKVFRD